MNNNNYIFSLTNNLYIKYLILNILKFVCIILLLNIFYYYNFFIGFKESMVLNCQSLVDFTCLHYFDLINEMELNYFILSYKLSFRFIVRLMSKKENLIISLSKLFFNST